MAQKVYKDGYTVIVDPPLSDELKYTTATLLDFGFDNDNCWIKSLVSDRYVFNDDVANMQNSAGVAVGNKAAVNTYLLAFIGDPTDTSSPI